MIWWWYKHNNPYSHIIVHLMRFVRVISNKWDERFIPWSVIISFYSHAQLSHAITQDQSVTNLLQICSWKLEMSNF